MKCRYFFPLVVLSLLLIACGTIPTSGSEMSGHPASPKSEIISLVYERSGGLAGVVERWTIFPDGRVIPDKGAERTVPAEQVAALLADVEKAGLSAMQDSYGLPGSCRDCFIYRITVNYVAGKAKSVSVVEGNTDVPAQFMEIVQKIAALVGRSTD